MFRFATPWAFVLLIPWTVAVWRVWRRRRHVGVLFAPVRRLPSRTGGWRVTVASLMPAAFLLALLLLIIAAARPQTFFARERRQVDSLAIMMVVDVSGSMEALDLSPVDPARADAQTRLDVVKELFAEFIGKRPDDLIGLVAFGGYASTRSPLTADHRALLQILKATTIPRQELDGQGQPVDQEELLTAVGDGLATACARLEKAEPNTKIVVLLSDGESNTGIVTPRQAAEIASKMGIRVYTIGVGTTGRAPFRTRDIFGRETIGHALVSMNEEELRDIADKTEGRYFNVRDREGFSEAMATIDELETTPVERNVYHHYNERFIAFLWPGAVLLMLSLLLNLALVRRIA